MGLESFQGFLIWGPGLSHHVVFLGNWARHLTLTVPLTTQVYKWVSASLKLGLLVSHPGRSKNISNGLIIHVHGNLQDKHWWYGPNLGKVHSRWGDQTWHSLLMLAINLSFYWPCKWKLLLSLDGCWSCCTHTPFPCIQLPPEYKLPLQFAIAQFYTPGLQREVL